MGSTIVWHKKYYTGSTEKKMKKKQSESIHEVQWHSIKKEMTCHRVTNLRTEA